MDDCFLGKWLVVLRFLVIFVLLLIFNFLGLFDDALHEMWVFKDHSLFRCSFSYLDLNFFFFHFLGLVCFLDAWLYIYVNTWMLLKYFFVVYRSFLRFILFYFFKLIEFLSMILVLFWCIFFFIYSNLEEHPFYVFALGFLKVFWLFC